MISKDDVILAQKKWSDGLLEIVGKHINNLDYVSCASDFIDRLYDYQNCEVLFKFYWSYFDTINSLIIRRNGR